MNSDEHAFLASIKAAPSDDAPRLQYADWLDEQERSVECKDCRGDGRGPMVSKNGILFSQPCSACSGSGHVSNGCTARAEFIRVQCELANLNHHHPSTDRAASEQPDRADLKCECMPLRRRERELFDKHSRTWLPIVPTGYCWVKDSDGWIVKKSGEANRDVAKIEWSRGFVSQITAPMATLLGGPCQRCRHSRGYEPSDIWNSAPNPLGRWCDECKGQRRTPGILAAVDRSPVACLERVVSDKRPWRVMRMDGKFSWDWYNEKHNDRNDDDANIPEDVFNCLKGGRAVSDLWMDFDSEDAALNALSDALLALVRREAHSIA